MLVAGPSGSGRSNVLRLIADQLRDRRVDVYEIGAEDSGLRRDHQPNCAWDATGIDALLLQLREQLGFEQSLKVLIADDIDLIRHATFGTTVAGYDALRGLRIVASTASFSWTDNPLIKRVRENPRQLFFLQPESGAEVAAAAGVIRSEVLRLGLEFPPNRGVYRFDGQATVVHAFQTQRKGLP
jgi:hypothetical protein